MKTHLWLLIVAVALGLFAVASLRGGEPDQRGAEERQRTMEQIPPELQQWIQEEREETERGRVFADRDQEVTWLSLRMCLEEILALCYGGRNGSLTATFESNGLHVDTRVKLFMQLADRMAKARLGLRHRQLDQTEKQIMSRLFAKGSPLHGVDSAKKPGSDKVVAVLAGLSNAKTPYATLQEMFGQEQLASVRRLLAASVRQAYERELTNEDVYAEKIRRRTQIAVKYCLEKQMNGYQPREADRIKEALITAVKALYEAGLLGQLPLKERRTALNKLDIPAMALFAFHISWLSRLRAFSEIDLTAAPMENHLIRRQLAEGFKSPPFETGFHVLCQLILRTTPHAGEGGE